MLTWIGLGIMAAENDWLSDESFLTIRALACRGRDPAALAAIYGWLEERQKETL